MQLPLVLSSLYQLLYDLSLPAGLGALVLAGLRLRQEGGANFEIGGNFQKYILWAAIFLTVPGILAWLNAQGLPVGANIGAVGTSYIPQIEKTITSFVQDFLVGHLVPVIAATLVLKAVLDTVEGRSPLNSILASIFLLGVYGLYSLATGQWIGGEGPYQTADFLMNAWNYVATRICPIAAGLAVAGGILSYVSNRGTARYAASALGLLSVTGLWSLVKAMTGVN
jgi:hypothetical protein